MAKKYYVYSIIKIERKRICSNLNILDIKNVYNFEIQSKINCL